MAVTEDMVGSVVGVEVATGKAVGRTGPGNSSFVDTASNDYCPSKFRNPALESPVVVGEQKGFQVSPDDQRPLSHSESRYTG